MRDLESTVAADERPAQIEDAFPAEKERIAELIEETDERVQAAGRSASLIEETQKATLRVRDRLDRWMRDLATRSSGLQSRLEELLAEKALWELTRDQEREEELPAALQEQISESLEAIRGAEQSTRAARDKVLALQAAIAKEQSVLNELLARQRAEINQRSAAILQIDSLPLWKVFAPGRGDDEGVADQIEAVAKRHALDLHRYLGEPGVPLSTWSLLWLGFAVVLVSMRHKARLWVQRDRSLESAVEMLDRPLAGAAVLVAVLCNVVEAQAPDAWMTVVNLLLLLTLLFLLLGFLPKALRAAPYFLLALFVLLRAVELSIVGTATFRLALLALAFVGIACCGWFLRACRRDPDLFPPPWLWWATLGARLAALLFSAAVLANLFGSVRFAVLIAAGTADAIFTGLVLLIVIALARSVVRVGLITRTARRLGIAPDHSDQVRDTCFRIITAVAVVLWAAFVLEGYALYDGCVAAFSRALEWQITVGDLSLAPGNFLIFAFVIWLSIKLAALVEFVLDVLVMPRFDLARGVPHTISRLNRYAVILIGAAVATTAAGFDMSKATILVGALGVGVGFGLQNVVNNFVSGLILLFERPIRTGDSIEFGSASGKVEEIGMRATTVRTWQGAELIVPNASLISSDVVNWTRKHDRRRIEIPVGVAYDCDPDEVASLLVEAANSHPDVILDPAPQCLFRAFGNSSLDFELRAWGPATKALRIESELRFAIIRNLREAGIEIPYPQRDVHLRSPGAADPAALEPAPEGDPQPPLASDDD